MAKEWKKINTNKVFETPWFYIDEDKLVTPAGKDVTYYTMRKSNGSAIIPVDGNRIFLVKVFRPSLFKYSWELPMGTAHASAPEEVAKIELREETGFSAAKWTFLGQYAGAPGSMDQLGDIYLAEGLTRGEPDREDAEADMELKPFTLEEIDNMIRAGELFDNWTIGALYLYRLHLTENR